MGASQSLVTSSMSDAPSIHSAEDFAAAIASNLPQGAAWSRQPDSGLMGWVEGCAQIWGDVSSSADRLIFQEANPVKTVQMLPDWEEAYGLPDPCVQKTLTVTERKTALLNKIRVEGGASRAFFVNVARTLGYDIKIVEFRPFQFGLNRFGQKLTEGNCRYYWRVVVASPRVAPFRFGNSSAGTDSFLEITRAEDLECVINRWKPAHTYVQFEYLQYGALFDFFFNI